MTKRTERNPDTLRAEIARVRQTLDALNNMAAQGLPVDEALKETQERLDTLEARIVSLGDVVTGQKTIVFDQRGQTVSRQVNIAGDVYIGPAPQSSAEALTIYRRLLIQTIRDLPLQAMDVGASDPTIGQTSLELAAVYVDLDTTTQVSLGDSEHKERVFPLSALAATIANRRLVLLGDPGSGKTAFINYLTQCLAFQTLQPDADWLASIPGWPLAEAQILPIIVSLRRFAHDLPDPLPHRAEPHHLWDLITTQLKAQNLAFAIDPIHRVLEQGQSIVFLDGLDELPSLAQRTFMRDAVIAFARRYPDNRYLVACRTLAYQPPTSSGEPDLRLPKFSIFELAQFDETKIDRFIEAWYEELARSGVVWKEDAVGLARGLREAVRRPDLWRLASNPLLLTVMALVHAHKGRLPDARAVLYEDTVDILLWRWEQIKAGGREEAPRLRQLLLEAGRTDVDLKRVLWRLAYEVQARVGEEENQEQLRDIGELHLQKSLASLKGGDRTWARRVVDAMKLRAGLLLERRPGVFTFPHRTFQEYLAGAHLASQPDLARRATALFEEGAAWREVILLAVGRLVFMSGDTDKPLALVGTLCPARTGDDELAWRKAWLAGDVLLEIGTNRVTDSALGRDMLARVQERSADLLAQGRLPARERAAVGHTLAILGDPRDLNELVAVPAGPFLMGSDHADEMAMDREKPQHEMVLSAFKIGKYPISNAQYQKFVEATESVQPSDQEQDLGRNNHPAVNISWHDAQAYCVWLTKEWRAKGIIASNEAVRLPTEAEWEKAARGIYGRRYPWGDEWDGTRCNTKELGLADSCAVGIFPLGASPYGCLDMAGQVWEWTSSLWGSSLSSLEFKYPYYPSDGRENPATGNEMFRVIRGGVWADSGDYARCAYRSGYASDSSWRYIGFRVAVVPLPSTILDQAATFFARVGFQIDVVNYDLGEAIMKTKKWASHSKFGDILLQVFEGNLTGDHLREMEKRIKMRNTSSEIAYAVYDGELSDDAFWQMGAYKIGTGLAIVPLKASVMSEALVSQDAKYYGRLRSIEQEYLGRGVNRYEESNAIQDPTWFFGRRQEADEIVDRLRAHQHAGIFGMRKVGKTSLLLHLRQRLSRESIPIAYIGLQSKPIDPPKLFAEIVRQIRFFIQALGIGAVPECKILKVAPHRVTDQMVKDDILALWGVAEKSLKAPFMALMIDEVERILPGADSDIAGYQKYDEFFAPIRDLSQVERCLVSVVTAERPTIREEFDTKFLPNAMFELYDERYLSFFSYDECSNMVVKIGKWMGIEYSSNSLQRIFEETAGHPYIARLLCACLADGRKSGRITVRDVDKAIDASLDKLNTYFKGWWKNLASDEKRQVESVLTRHVLPTQLNERQSDALRHLEKQGFIQRTPENRWDITIRLLRRWFEWREGVQD